jgi:hypothetical protein
MKNRYALLLLGVVAVILAAMYVLAQQEGAIDIKTPGAVLQLNSLFGGVRTLRSESGTTTVPARTYKPTALELRWQQGGDTWQMWSHGPWGQLSRIKVARRRTTAIELGPPLRIKPQVGVYRRQVTVDLGIFGRSGEKYTNLICKNDRRVEVPQVRIIDEAGAVLESGPGKYG